MKPRDYLKFVSVVSFAGVLFSGYLTLGELFPSGIVCTTCTKSLIFGFPACIYGLAMYLLIFGISIYGCMEGS